MASPAVPGAITLDELNGDEIVPIASSGQASVQTTTQAIADLASSGGSITLSDTFGDDVLNVTHLVIGPPFVVGDGGGGEGDIINGVKALSNLTEDCATNYASSHTNIIVSGTDAVTILATIEGGSGQYNLLLNPPQDSASPRVMNGGDNNTAVGTGAFQNTRNSSFNTVVGSFSLQDLQQDAGDDSGGDYDGNTVVGHNSLANLIKGTNNVVIGAASANTPDNLPTNNNIIISGDVDDGAQNRIVMGVIDTGGIDNTVRIGNSSVTAYAIGGPVAVASLPSASTMGAGSRAFVNNANTTIILGIGTTVVGGGSNKVPVYSDGTNWLIG